MNLRTFKGTMMMTICGAVALFAAAMLLYIIVVIFLKGVASLNPHFILFSEINTGLGLGTGVGNAVAGTILLAVISTILAIPLGVGTAIYLSKYASDNQFTRFLRLMIEVLSGTPSIVLGIFGVAILVIYLKSITGGESLIAGAIALGILIIPVIERSTEEALSRVPCELEEGSYALGATKWLTIRNIVIPYALSGIIVGAILGFGRAAEESAVVLLTAGYSQYMPQFRIAVNPNFLLGIKIFPFNDLVGSLPVFLYTSYENSNVFPISSIFAAGFILIVIVLIINLSAKAILFYATAKTHGHQGDLLSSFCGSISDRFLGKQPKALPSYSDIIDPAPPDEKNTKKEDPVGALRSPRILPVDLSWIDTEPLIDEPSSGETETPEPVPPAAEPPKPTPRPTRIKILSAGTGMARLMKAIREKARMVVHNNLQKKTPADSGTVRGTADRAGSLRKTQPFNIGTMIGSVCSFLITLAPFVLVAVILMALSIMLPSLAPVGSNGPAGSLTVPFMALILGMIGTVCALFLVRNSTLFMLRRRKGRMGNRRAEFAAIALGICVVLVSAFIFSTHIFSSAPSIPSLGSESSAGTGIFSYFTPSGSGGFFGITEMINFNSLFEFLHLSGPSAPATATASLNRSARLAELLAAEETPAENTPTPSQASPIQPSLAPSPAVQVVSSATPVVPAKYALDLGESYWYGDNSRPCFVTVYNATVLPFYFWWDMDWNRFVQQTPATSGDVFLVIFIRIEATGNMSAIVPSADQFIVTNNGQTYTHNIYFDTSVLSANEISYYTANYNALPYQWIREIGGQKRDYAYLTGFNVFGQNQTFLSNYTANSATSPPSATTSNGQGYFIQPGRSNAIDGYLIYEVPPSVAADLKDTYVQVPFNSFSATQWRLGK